MKTKTLKAVTEKGNLKCKNSIYKRKEYTAISRKVVG